EWSKDGAVLLVGLRPRLPADSGKARAPAEKLSDVQVWHSRDVRLMRAQELQEQQDLQRTLALAWHLGDGSVTRLGSDLLETVRLLPGGRFATETDRKPYAWGQMFGRPYSDTWVINVTTGQRTKAIEKVRYSFGASPNGRKLLWYDGKDYWSYDVESGARSNLTAGLQADFSTRDWDYPGDERPPAGLAVWPKHG